MTTDNKSPETFTVQVSIVDGISCGYPTKTVHVAYDPPHLAPKGEAGVIKDIEALRDTFDTANADVYRKALKMIEDYPGSWWVDPGVMLFCDA